MSKIKKGNKMKKKSFHERPQTVQVAVKRSVKSEWHK